MILLVQVSLPQKFCWKSDVFIASLPFCISRYNTVPNLEYTTLFNYVPNEPFLMDINE